MIMKSVLFCIIFILSIFTSTNARAQAIYNQIFQDAKSSTRTMRFEKFNSRTHLTETTIMGNVVEVKLIERVLNGTDLGGEQRPHFIVTAVLFWDQKEPIMIYEKQKQLKDLAGKRIVLTFSEEKRFYGKQAYCVNILKEFELLDKK